MSDVARIFRVAKIETRVVDFDWPFARDSAEAVAAHWAGMVAKNPTLFDGRVLLSNRSEHAARDGVLQSDYFETSFSAFMAWRDFGFPDRAIVNGFAMAALRSADGAFLLGEMAAHTANAGKVYFPAGTPDLDDIVGASVDLAGSVARELREETGIELSDEEIDPVWTIVHLGPRVACMRPVRLKASAEEIVAQVADYLARDEHPELAGMRIVRSMADLDGLKTPEFVRAYLAHEFST